MAVIDEVPGLEVGIVVNKQRLQEHQDRDADISPKTAERYIEAQSGAEYEIYYSFKDPFPGDRTVSMIVTVDGKDMDEPIIRPFELFDVKGHASQGHVSRQGRQWVVQKYSFSQIDIRETGAETIPKDLKEKLKHVGIITCEFYFLNNPRRNTGVYGAQKDVEALKSVSEKAIKGDALSHQTVLSDIAPAFNEVEYFDADYADGGEPFATFHFYYRSLAALKDLRIVERTPDPLDIFDSDDSAIGQLNREQLEAIVRRLRDQETRSRMKRERSDSATVVGDDDDIGDRSLRSDPDLIEGRWVDLRAERKKMRVRQLPTPDSEVIELDD